MSSFNDGSIIWASVKKGKKKPQFTSNRTIPFMSNSKAQWNTVVQGHWWKRNPFRLDYTTSTGDTLVKASQPHYHVYLSFKFIDPNCIQIANVLSYPRKKMIMERIYIVIFSFDRRCVFLQQVFRWKITFFFLFLLTPILLLLVFLFHLRKMSALEASWVWGERVCWKFYFKK